MDTRKSRACSARTSSGKKARVNSFVYRKCMYYGGFPCFLWTNKTCALLYSLNDERLSVRLLVASTSRWTSVLLGLAATRIYPSNQRSKPNRQQSENDRKTQGDPWSLSWPARQRLTHHTTQRLPTLLIEGDDRSGERLADGYVSQYDEGCLP